jgi:hypothetical protein
MQVFSDRFADLPVKLAELSRFRSSKEVKAALEGIKAGTIDLVIGTHKLIQSDVVFKNLGLVIIDEEHRFGVRQKEQLKKLRAEVDVLTLTATPIPAHARDVARRHPRLFRDRHRAAAAAFDQDVRRRVLARNHPGGRAARAESRRQVISCTTTSTRSRRRPTGSPSSCRKPASRSRTARWGSATWST